MIGFEICVPFVCVCVLGGETLFAARRASFSTIHVHMAIVLSWAGERSEPGFSEKSLPWKALFSAPISQKIRAARASPGCEPSPGTDLLNLPYISGPAQIVHRVAEKKFGFFTRK